MAIRGVGHEASMGKRGNVYKILVTKPERKKTWKT
jgi:hypothetical protein